MKRTTWLRGALTAALLVAAGAAAQAPSDPAAARLRQVLPADVASRVLARVADARAHHLAAEALEQRALKFAARGVAPADIERAVYEQAERMMQVKPVLDGARGHTASADEVDAAAEALRSGASASQIAELARSAPSGRSLAVPLFVLGDLTTRGVPASDALHMVVDRLAAKTSDADLERLPDQAAQRPGADGARSRSRPGGEAGGAKPPAASHAPHPPPMPRPAHAAGRRP